MARPSELGLRSYCGAKVERRRDKVLSEAVGRKRRRWSGDVLVRTCCTFLQPASWVSTLGHLMAAERSRWRRDLQESTAVYSEGAYKARR